MIGSTLLKTCNIKENNREIKENAPQILKATAGTRIFRENVREITKIAKNII